MKLLRLFLICGFAASQPVWAVYAPIPEQDQGKAWSFDLKLGVTHDSNIFGASSGEISSTIYTVSPQAAFNASVTSQTFVSASYQLTVDNFENRPGTKTLDSHVLMGRLAHAFTQSTTIDVSDAFMVQKNPESLLPGVAIPISSDQSFQNNEFNASFSTNLDAKSGVTLKVRSVLFLYDNARLATNLDRIENIYGLSVNYTALPELKLVGEYRHQTIAYDQGGSTKDKSSDFVLAGVDYNVAKKVSASGRLGFEYRHRDSESNDTVPFVELSTKYDYAQGSFLTAGYVYTLEESSNVTVYTDTQVNRFFLNVQHALTPLITASGSIDYEPSQLQGRTGNADADETTTRFGLALSYLPTKNWTISASYDYDQVSSDDVARELTRNRVGLTGRYSF